MEHDTLRVSPTTNEHDNYKSYNYSISITLSECLAQREEHLACVQEVPGSIPGVFH